MQMSFFYLILKAFVEIVYFFVHVRIFSTLMISFEVVHFYASIGMLQKMNSI
uniref:Uncharacterized protein n=1 Tax=Rhizophora mucronata TaxID=61149 RepID=A0A2P2P4C0_RHIMU